MIIIDFDDTLFNTHKFKKDRLEALKDVGVSEEVYWETYLKARNSNDGLFTYSNERHANVLEASGFEKEKVLEALEKTTSGLALKNTLSTGAESMLKEFKQKFSTVILLSLGDPAFQELKTKGAGISEYFERIFFVDDSKEHVMKNLLENHKPEQVWFVSDKVSETKKIVEQIPEIKSVLKVSKNIDISEYENSGLPFFQTLEEITKYVTDNS